MLYAGQQILRGHAPYVGVTIVKLPVSPLVAAAGIATGRAFGIDDILAGRIAFWLCASVSVGAMYLLGAQIVRDGLSLRGANLATKQSRNLPNGDCFAKTARNDNVAFRILPGSIAAATLVSFQTLGIQVAEGPEAKLPMVCAGMMCLVLLAREKFFWAGIAGALAFMAWQPGLIFVVVTLLAVVFATQRKRALTESLLGVTIPIVLVGIYLAFNGALGSMFRQAFGANANYLGEKKVAAGIFSVVAENVQKVWSVSAECSATEMPLVVLGFVGIIAGTIFLAWHFWKTRDAKFSLRVLPLWLSGAALFAFSFLDLQKCSDLVALLPYLALGAAFLVISLISFVAVKNTRVSLALGIIFTCGILLYGTLDAFNQPRQTGLLQQRALAREINAQLAPNDAVQQFGDTVFLVLTQRENATRFVHLGEKQGLGILTAEGVSMDALVQQLQNKNPRVVTLSRAKAKEWAQPLYAWIEKNYELKTSYAASEGGTLKETDVWWKK